MTIEVNDGGTWKTVTSPSVYDAGVWKTPTEVWVNDAGTWKLAWTAVVTTFTPDSGTYSAEAEEFVSYTITCSVSATWTWSKGPGQGAFGSVPTGGSATEITFSVSAAPGPPGEPSITRGNTFTVAGTANGVTKNYTINLTAIGGSGI